MFSKYKMEYIIVIPSYKRAKQLQARTLTTLHKLGINKERINVFVVKEEYDEYLETLNKDYYNKLIVGEKGLVNQREFIEQYYPIDTKIVSLDDDIDSIDVSLTEHNKLDDFIQYAFQKCVERNVYIWSVYPVYNPFFRKDRNEIKCGLSYLIGAFYGFINRRDEDIKLRLTREDNKEDVERSILYYLKDGKTLRFDRIGFKTKYYGIGGMGSLKERLEPMKKYAEIINKEYPLITKLKIRKNGLYEIVLKETKQLQQQVIQLHEIDAGSDCVSELYYLLSNRTIPSNDAGKGRSKTFGKHRSMTLGYVKARFSGIYGLSYYSKKYNELYDSILRFGKEYVPFEFNAIQVNHNVVCPRHLDSKNCGNSMLVSLGDYTGCDIVVEGCGTFNTNLRPIIFNGAEKYHYNTPLISGDKYSIVFFSHKEG
jgi:hypothetical protein